MSSSRQTKGLSKVTSKPSDSLAFTNTLRYSVLQVKTDTIRMTAINNNIESLREKVTKCAETVSNLKKNSPDEKSAIAIAVKEMLAAKKEFADNNDGIGVEGKPYQAPMSKAEKKAKEKAEKTSKAAAALDSQNEGASNSKKADKKAAKKAAKAAAKKSHKEAAGSQKPSQEKTDAGGQSKQSTLKSWSRMSIPENEIVMNPNVPLYERPVIALTMAILTNTILDYTISQNHLARHSALGLPGGNVVVGDIAMAHYLLKSKGKSAGDPQQQALVDTWVNYAQSLKGFPDEQTQRAVMMTLDNNLSQRTYLVGEKFTMADVAMFSAIGFPSQTEDRKLLLKAFQKSKTAQRWLKLVADHPAVKEATQLVLGSHKEAAFEENESDKMEPLASGMNLLEGGVLGRVVTRFPPEPSGYLHIGHSKAVLLNDYYARRYKGRLIVRFDDTNPSKEKEEFQTSIVEDLAKLGVQPDLITFTSDYFDTTQAYAIQMIQEGIAYMDDTPQEQMKLERMDRKESKHRNQSVEQALDLFKAMCSSSSDDDDAAKWCLRAKIDMSSDNGTMRDPVLYRCNASVPHHRTGTRYKAYPTYDLACPIVDSLEGVSHALRTTEYNDRDEQYQWIQKALQIRRVRVHAFSRVNFNYTVMSKRKLAWFVSEGLVDGWNDPRFPTIRGVVRRGIHIGALRQFMYSQGASRNVVQMDWSKFWAENKKKIDVQAKRFMAIAKDERTAITITNAPTTESLSFVTTDYHPKDPSLGSRKVRIADKIWLEAIDAQELTIGEEFVLMRWGVMKVTAINGDASNRTIEAEFIPEGDFKAAKKKISWIADCKDNTPCILTEFDNLIAKEKLEEDDILTECLTPITKAESFAEGDAGLKTLEQGVVIQLERRGYYCVDQPYKDSNSPLILYMIPDGKSKAMSGLAGKIAHR
mmetsp:Transcript_16524/g.18349  ORF Transcript_16524/g.18349 Transcript_16524/m.18349 type:complete len:923 (+) Transcript_16524:60-2828(+)